MGKNVVIAGVIKESPHLGCVLVPCVCRKDNPGFLTVAGLLSAQRADKFDDDESCFRELFDLSTNIDPGQLAVRFSKKKVSTETFFKTAEKNLIDHVLMPYVWKQTDRMIQVMREHDIEIFDGRPAWPNLYPENKISILQGKPELILHFDRKEDGTLYTLEVLCENEEIDLHLPGTLILTVEACHLVHDNRLMRFDPNISGKLLKPFLLKREIHIPKHIEKQYFNGFIRKVANRVDIKADGFEMIDLTLDPAAKLLVEMDWQGCYGFMLCFDYGDRRVLANNTQTTFTALESDETDFTFRRFHRDLEKEKQMTAKLLALPLEKHGAFYRLKNDQRSQEAVVSFILDNKTFLERSGFVIEQQEDGNRFVLTRPEIVLRNYHYTDWFDLHILIRVGDTEIPFMDLKEHILHRRQVYMLPTGEQLLIPEEWFERYKGLMVHAQTKEGQFRLERHHYGLLDHFDLPEAKDLSDTLEAETSFAAPRLQDVALRPYQVSGVCWMKKLAKEHLGGILADDMGLGKTLQVIALLSSYYMSADAGDDMKRKTAGDAAVSGVQLSLFGEEANDHPGIIEEPDQYRQEEKGKPPALIVMPASIVHNWENEINRFSPWLKRIIYTGSARKLTPDQLDACHVILTTYGTLRNDVDILKEITFGYIILDESQHIKNPHSKSARAAFALKGYHHLTLTGTPIENNLADIWSQMHFANPGLLGGLRSFQQHYSMPVEKDPEAPEAEQLYKIIRPYIMRRTKDQVAPELPPVTETRIFCDMTDVQASMYEREKSRLRNFVMEAIHDKQAKSRQQMMLLKALMKLRQIANHPRLADNNYDGDSGKFEAITDRLSTVVAENHKVLVFSSFVTHLELLELWCRQSDIRYVKLTGSTRKREEVIRTFEKEEVPVFLISLKAGGVGLNLTAAGYVFLIDPWWNPAAEMQAVDRAHRIGQEKNVFVYRFLSRDTVEEKITRLQEKKQRIAGSLVQAEQFVPGLSAGEMTSLFD